MNDLESNQGNKSNTIQLRLHNIRDTLKILGLSFVTLRIGFILIIPKFSRPVVGNACIINFGEGGMVLILIQSIYRITFQTFCMKYSFSRLYKQKCYSGKPKVSEAVWPTFIL